MNCNAIEILFMKIMGFVIDKKFDKKIRQILIENLNQFKGSQLRFFLLGCKWVEL